MEDGPADNAAARVLYVLLPFWVVPALLDHRCHAVTEIERTSGTHESLTHALMGAVSGVPVVLSLAFETTPSIAAIAVIAAAAHEAIVLWDVAYAAPLRPIGTNEQHVHSFLEVMPLTMLALTIAASPAAFARLDRALPLRFERRRTPPSRRYVALILGLGAVAGLMFAEEIVRCFRVDRTLAPHHRPDGDGEQPRNDDERNRR